MKWFMNLSTRGKLVLSFSLMLVALAIVIGDAYRSMVTIQAAQRRVYDVQFANAIDLINLRLQETALYADLLGLMAQPNGDDAEALHQDIDKRGKAIADGLQGLLDRNREDARLIGRVHEIAGIYDDLVQTRNTKVLPLIRAGKVDQARALVLSGIQQERYQRMHATVRTLRDDALTEARMAMADSERLAAQSLRQIVLVGSIAVALALVMVFLFDRIIAKPLRSVAALVGQVAAGDLTVAIPKGNHRDEVGNLLDACGDMIDKLRTTTRDLHQGVNVLASSASEILTTTTQVAAGAAETATAVSETSATVEEVKQTAQVANQKARYLSDNAQKAAQVAQTGIRSVEDTIDGMHRIQEQMESIAESIVHLSEQSQSIGEIIATVNDLAEQSNVLAVNAAIEATKAGEQGKGFGVVAQEVKSLAEQSKQATAQVRIILGDVQKATSAAVLATEQGHKAVDAGVRESAETATSIRQLAATVSEAAQAATQIAASSQQQMVGMDQVALAMDNIKTASTQNVAGTRQAETAAQNLHELGARLKQMADQYKV